MQAEELQGQFRTADLLKVEDATLVVNGNAQDESPSPHDISEAVLNLRTGQFVIVAFDEEIYMQALKRQQGYGLEHRKGSADQHFRLDAEIEPQALIDTLVAYLRREQSWAALQWERMRL